MEYLEDSENVVMFI